jgi:hypothetical protein
MRPASLSWTLFAAAIVAIVAFDVLSSASVNARVGRLADQTIGCSAHCVRDHRDAQGRSAGEFPAETVRASAASAAWKTEPIAGQGRKGILEGVSCVTSSACVAVGYTDSYNALVENSNATRWAMAPDIDSDGKSQLFAVSCSSVTACTAVGLDGQDQLIAQWNGALWTTQTTPSSVSLRGVSCVSSTMCVAVGFRGLNRPAAELWNGAGWKVEPTPSLPRTRYAQSALYGVSCASPTACTAVGFRTDSDGNTGPLAERWNGTGWKLQSTRTSLGPASQLLGVSCVSTIDCTAVGFYGPPEDDSPADVPMAARWNGKGWRIDRAAGSGFDLSSVSCVSAAACTAVGGGSASGGSVHVEAWNGKRWTLQAN